MKARTVVGERRGIAMLPQIRVTTGREFEKQGVENRLDGYKKKKRKEKVVCRAAELGDNT